MVKTIRLKTNTSNYLIRIGNLSFKKIINDLKKQQTYKYILIDTEVYKNFRSYFNKLKGKDVTLIKINSSEKIKSIKTYWNITSQLLDKKISRSSIIVAIGGGTLGDLVGFIASTILRGVKFILIPTTLLSQVDSSIGGKNGINSKFAKNAVGTFYHPSMVIVDPIFLKSLSNKELKSGYAEIVKHALINDEKFFQWLSNNYKDLFKLKTKKIIYAINKSIKIKTKFVINDEKETLNNSSSRAMLNFGHTFGHALESINNYKSSLSHGEAISIGMVIATKISYLIGRLPKYQLDEIMDHFKNCGLPIKSSLIKKEKFYKLLINDKKNQNDEINLILLNKIGKAFYAKNFELIKLKNLISQTL